MPTAFPPFRISSSIAPSPSGLGFCGTDTTAGITLCNPPQSGSFSGASHYAYVEGRLSRDVGGFFGAVLGLRRAHISVRAVAWHGGFHQPYAVIGLASSDCSVSVQNAGSSNAGLIVTGSALGCLWL